MLRTTTRGRSADWQHFQQSQAVAGRLVLQDAVGRERFAGGKLLRRGLGPPRSSTSASTSSARGTDDDQRPGCMG